MKTVRQPVTLLAISTALCFCFLGCGQPPAEESTTSPTPAQTPRSVATPTSGTSESTSSQSTNSGSSSSSNNFPAEGSKTIVDPVTKGSYQAPRLNKSNIPTVGELKTDFEDEAPVARPVRAEPAVARPER